MYFVRVLMGPCTPTGQELLKIIPAYFLALSASNIAAGATALMNKSVENSGGLPIAGCVGAVLFMAISCLLVSVSSCSRPDANGRFLDPFENLPKASVSMVGAPCFFALLGIYPGILGVQLARVDWSFILFNVFVTLPATVMIPVAAVEAGMQGIILFRKCVAALGRRLAEAQDEANQDAAYHPA